MSIALRVVAGQPQNINFDFDESQIVVPIKDGEALMELDWWIRDMLGLAYYGAFYII
jgi:hypothetical protein